MRNLLAVVAYVAAKCVTDHGSGHRTREAVVSHRDAEAVLDLNLGVVVDEVG